MANGERTEAVQALFDALTLVSQAMAATDDKVTRDDLHRVVLTLQSSITLATIRQVLLDRDDDQ